MSSGVREPYAPTSTPPSTGAISMPMLLAVCPIAPAFARLSRPTIAGVSALSVGPVIASPAPSTATRAMIAQNDVT